MIFPLAQYNELPLERRNTLQVFITNRCNLSCKGCFARKVMTDERDMPLSEYQTVIDGFLDREGKQITLLGGEPLLHPNLREMIKINKDNDLKTTIYTNGKFINQYAPQDFDGTKLRVSLYCKTGTTKSLDSLPKTDIPFEVCFMVSKQTSLDELVNTAKDFEARNGKVFFISSLRELDNEKKEFFQDTTLTMPLLEYKQLVHDFLREYKGYMEVHVSKRGVFESTTTLADNKCRFANYFSGGKIIQCPYDVVNLKFQKDYSFGERFCQHNNSCLMSKIKLKRKPDSGQEKSPLLEVHDEFPIEDMPMSLPGYNQDNGPLGAHDWVKKDYPIASEVKKRY